MVSISKHVQDFLPGKLAWVATASLDGEPNVTCYSPICIP
jgi:predicted pyridoxine 5'-phosphate oxidase superfamily flavin-nucleotide-binding protein